MTTEPLWTVQGVLSFTASHFEKRGIDAPRLTAEVLLAKALGCSRVRLYMELDRPLTPDERSGYRALVERRASGAPTHYLLGEKEFFGHAFAVDARVLVPRPETELLVERLLERLPEDARRVADPCTGSGCIAVSVALARPELEVVATELSPEACTVARQNIERHGLSDRVTLLEGDLLEPLFSADGPASGTPTGSASGAPTGSASGAPTGSASGAPAGSATGSGSERALFDAIISNPPYIERAALAALPREVRQEPRMALDGGDDGLDLVRRLLPQARGLLKPGGLLALELGEAHSGPALALLAKEGFVGGRMEQDLAGHARFAWARAPGGPAWVTPPVERAEPVTVLDPSPTLIPESEP